MFCLDPRPRAEDLDIKAQFVRSYIGTEIYALAAGGPATDLPDRGALCGDNTRVATKRPTIRRHLRQKQHRRHQGTDAVVSGADITSQAHHSLAARQRYNVKAISARTNQGLG